MISFGSDEGGDAFLERATRVALHWCGSATGGDGGRRQCCAHDRSASHRRVQHGAETERDLVRAGDVASHRRAALEPSRHPFTRKRRVRVYVLRRDDMPRGVRALNGHAERCIRLHECWPGA